MASQSPTRRVLSSLDVNTRVGLASPLLAPGTKHGVDGPLNLKPIKRMASLAAPKVLADLEAGAASGVAKRPPGDLDRGASPSNKRLRMATEDEDASLVAKSSTSAAAMTSHDDDHAPMIIPATPSPASSQEDPEMTQNTALTESDDKPRAARRHQSPPSQPMTREALRETAMAIRDRLRLAKYKMETGQMDVPLSELQVRTLAGSSRSSFPTSNPSRRISRARPELPRRLTLSPKQVSASQPSLPTISLTRFLASSSSTSTSRASRRFIRTEPSSSPPPFLEIPPTKPLSNSAAAPDSSPDLAVNIDPSLLSPTKAVADDDAPPSATFTTPINPRQRASLLHPPALDSPSKGRSLVAGSDLTSSVVKGRAADALASLSRYGEQAMTGP